MDFYSSARAARSILLISCIAILSACGGGGGGGGGGGSSSPQQLTTQTVTFLFTEVKMTAGDTFGNIASARGTGAITYSSSDTEIASVDSTGQVTALKKGSITITATVAADSVYSGASASYSLTIKELASQTLTFNQEGPITLTEGEVLLNSASAPGDGNLIYSSSNEDIAVVNNDGYVTALKVGTVVITATKKRDDVYYDATNSYTLNIIAQNSLTIRAWLGSDDAILTLPPSANGSQLYGSSFLNCDFVNYLECLNGHLDILGGNTILASSSSLAATGYYLLKTSLGEAKATLGTERFANRYRPQVISHNNQVFLFGGHDGNFNYFNDVWSSPDGRIWTQLSSNSHFTNLGKRKIVTFNNKLWAVGGISDNYSDIWSSTDGISWSLEVSNTPFSARYFHQIVTFNNQLWLVGGIDEDGLKNDIWTSSDGISWSQASSSAAFVADRRTVTGNGFGSYITPDSLVAFKDKLWLFRGPMNSDTHAELWSSVDGVNWEKVAAPLDVIQRTHHQVVAHKGELLIISGDQDGSGGVIQSSEDGTTWSQIPTNFSEDVRDHIVIVHDNKLISIGGSVYDNYYSGTDVLVSSDGAVWKQQTPYADFPSRDWPQAVSFNDRLWVIGGDFKNDIWSSSDGIIWTEHAPPNKFIDQFSSANLIAFKNKLWLIGAENTYDDQNETWSSLDGVSWTLEAPPAEFPIRYKSHLIEHDGHLWLYGGTSDGILNDLWVSSDGVHWTQKSENLPFGTRYKPAFISYKNRLWIIGGRYLSALHNDVWSSTDGVNWTQETTNAGFSPRQSHQIVVFNNQLWLSGGNDDEDYKNDIWSSTDGINWTEQTDHAAFSERGDHKVLPHTNKLFLFGGEKIVSENNPLNSLSNDVWFSADGVNWRLGTYEKFRFPE